MSDLLSGIRILAVSQFGAGPFGTMHLADLGAEVIKVENPAAGGDVSRTVPPYTVPGDSLYFQSLNRNKRSVTLDLSIPAGLAVFHDLVRVSHGVFSNLRGDLPVKLGLTYDSLKEFNPAIVCCSLSGFGMTGPRRAEPAYDYLVQAYAGWMSLTGEPGAMPARSGLSLVDFSAGITAMVGLLAGLLRAQKTGAGCDIDVSLLDTAVGMLSYLAVWMLNRGFHPERMAESAHPTLCPAQAFQTCDGYIVVFCAKEKFWRLLAAAVDAPELAKDDRFGSFAARHENRVALLSELKPRFRSRTTADWLARLRGKVPCAPVNDVEQALADEQVLARQLVIEVDHPEFGAVRQVRSPIRVPGAADEHRPAPGLGADTQKILREVLGYSEARIKGLRAARVI